MRNAWIDGYLNDLLAGVILVILLYEIQQTINTRLHVFLNPKTYPIFIVFVGLIWEIFGSYIHHNAVFDLADVLAYTIPSFVFIVLIIKRGNNSVQEK